MDTILAFIKLVEDAFRQAPEFAFQVSLIYSVLIFAFFMAALIKRSKSALVWAVLLAAGITASYTAIKLIKASPRPSPQPVEKIIKLKVVETNADEAIMKISEQLFDRALNLKMYGFNKLPLYQKEIVSNRLISVMKLAINETPNGVEAVAEISEKDLYNVLNSLGYKKEGKKVVIEIVNPEEVNLLPEEASALIEGIKRTSVFFLDDMLYTDIIHLRQELVGMELGRGIVVSDVRGTSTTVDIYLSRKQ